MSIALVVTGGFGNGTLTGSIANVITRGYSIGIALSLWTTQADSVTAWSSQADETTTWTGQADENTIWTVQ